MKANSKGGGTKKTRKQIKYVQCGDDVEALGTGQETLKRRLAASLTKGLLRGAPCQ